MLRKETPMDEMVSYIKKNSKKGYTKDSLRWALINQGYSRMEVEKALKKADQELATEAPQLSAKPIIKYEVIEPKKMETYTEKKSFWKKLFGK